MPHPFFGPNSLTTRPKNFGLDQNFLDTSQKPKFNTPGKSFLDQSKTIFRGPK